MINPGVYSFECWGTSGYGGTTGAYTYGEIYIDKPTKFFLHIGHSGIAPSAYPAYGGGGPGQSGGGGATDIRLAEGNYDNFDSLKSRIMVAGSGGGVDWGDQKGIGGTINGSASANFGMGGTQTSGGAGSVKGGFGFGGGNGTRIFGGGSPLDGNGGGGSGYFGGGNSRNSVGGGGGGGSSYISGHPGCISITENSTLQEIFFKETDQSFHYLGYIFKNTKMIDGNSEMPSPTGGFHPRGHSGNGFVRITLLFFNKCPTVFSSYTNIRFICIVLILL